MREDSLKQAHVKPWGGGGVDDIHALLFSLDNGLRWVWELRGLSDTNKRRKSLGAEANKTLRMRGDF